MYTRRFSSRLARSISLAHLVVVPIGHNVAPHFEQLAPWGKLERRVSVKIFDVANVLQLVAACLDLVGAGVVHVGLPAHVATRAGAAFLEFFVIPEEAVVDGDNGVVDDAVRSKVNVRPVPVRWVCLLRRAKKVRSELEWVSLSRNDESIMPVIDFARD
tara:strand:- start:66 stop:542 length:477 start_codon:yes stop_codon:yes gene_type:complete